MELKYVWIKKYKNLENIDFNFQHPGDGYFDFNEGFLTIKESKSKSQKGFFSNNIKGLTTIVGKNGSGKTNLSEFLTYNLAHVSGGLTVYMTGEGIIVLNDKIFVQKDIVINNKDFLNELGYEIIEYRDAPLDQSSQLEWHSMEKNKFIYYSPIHTYRVSYDGRGLDNMINISSSYLIRYDVYDTLKSVINDNTYSWQNKDSTDSLSAHYRNEKLRESDLFLNYEPIKKLIKIPNLIRFSIDHPSENNFLNHEYSSGSDEKSKQINKNYRDLNGFTVGFEYYQLEQYRLDIETSTGYEKFDIKGNVRKKAFKATFLINFFKGLLFFGNEPFPDDFLRQFIFEEEYELDDSKLLHKLGKLKSQLTRLIDLGNWKNITAKIIKREFSRDNERELQIYNLYRSFEIDLKENNVKETLLELIKITKSLIKNQLHFHYEFFHQFSAGEQNLLNFFSRFYYAKNQVLEIEKTYPQNEAERIIIFIDEGEVGYHPEWQRLYFNQVINYLSELFEDREIQLILTTHSPFVLSDIPKENVIFLNKDKNGNALKQEFEIEKTFGANIYSLLANSFFMENGTIGEFAKKKIEWVVEVLSNHKSFLNSEILKEVNYIIDSIGEPLIKQQLEIMRNNFLNRDKLSSLEKQVQELKDELRKRDDNDKNQ